MKFITHKIMASKREDLATKCPDCTHINMEHSTRGCETTKLDIPDDYKGVERGDPPTEYSVYCKCPRTFQEKGF